MHKTANVLAKLPKSQQPKTKRALQEIWMAETKAAAELAFDAFIESYTPKYEKAADCLSKYRHTLLTFDDFPAEHWDHSRHKRFFYDRDDDCRNRCKSILLSVAPRVILPSRPPISQPLEVAVSSDYACWARATSWRSVTRRLQASPDCLFCPAELRRPRAGFWRRAFHCDMNRS